MHHESLYTSASPFLYSLHPWMRDLHKIISSCKCDQAAAPASSCNGCTNPLELGWCCLGNWIYLFVAVVLGISEVHVLTHFYCSLHSLTRSWGFFAKNKRQALGWGLAAMLHSGRGWDKSWGAPWGHPGYLSQSWARKLPSHPAPRGQPAQGWDKQCNWNGG